MTDTNEKKYPWIDYVLNICTGANHFIVDDVKVFIAFCDMNFPADSHIHNDIEFMCVKRQTLNNVLCDDKVLTLPINHVIPFMPMQRHGCSSPVTIQQYIALAFPPEYCKKFYSVIKDFDFCFKNIAFPVSSRFDYLVGNLFEEYPFNNNITVMKDLLELIFIQLCRDYLNFVNPQKLCTYYGILKAKMYLDEHIDLPFDLYETSRVANMSKFYFCRMFSEKFGISPNSYLLAKKIEYSKIIMATTDKTLTEIAVELGFAALSHFSKQFKKLCGITPGEYRKTILK